jgi:hypothetical protein
MATLDQLERALQNAHTAGDADAANVFANEIIKMRQAPQATAAPQASAADEGIPQPRVPLPFNEATNYIGRALKNVPSSGANLVSGAYHAITNPIETVGNIADVAAGGLRAAVPEGVRNFIDKLDNPENTKRIADTASQFGGVIADRYGSPAAIAKTFETDPVGAAADLSMILGGAGGVARRMGATDVGGALTRGAELTNPINALAPVGNKVMSGAQGITNWLNPKNTTLLAAAEGRGPEIVNALRAPAREIVPGYMPTAAEAASEVSGTIYPAVQEILAKKYAPTPYAEQAGAAQAARAAAIQAVGETPEALAAAKTTRRNITEPLYTAAQEGVGPVNVKPALDIIDEALNKNPGNTALVKEMKSIRDNMAELTTPGDVSSIIDDIKIRLKNPENAFIKKHLVGIKDALIESVPGMEEAQKTFQTLSTPVNRMEVGQFLEGKLGTGLAAENASAFAEAVKNAPATIKKATGESRFDTLLQAVGDPAAVKAIEDVRADLMRAARTEEKAARGATAARDIVPDVTIKGPPMLNKVVTVANEILKKVGGKLSKKLAIEIATEMLNPEAAAIAMQKALDWEARNARIGQAVRGATQATTAPINALTALSAPVNQNALVGR